MFEGEGTWVERLPWYTVPALLLGIPALAWLLTLAWEPFYARVIWQYYWGPIVADANGGALCTGGSFAGTGCPPGETVAEPGYNVINTLSWAGLLGICIVGIWQMLTHFKTAMDDLLIYGATAWVVTGSVFHVLQDSKLLGQPLEFLFITPPIYLLFGAFGILSFVYGQYVRMVVERTGSLEAGLQKIWFLFSAIVLAYTLVWLAKWDQVVIYVNPVWVALFALITFGVVRLRAARTGRLNPSELVLTFSIGWFLLSMAYVYSYLQAPWPGKNPDSSIPYTFLIAPALAAATAGIVYLVARWAKSKGNKAAVAFMMPINLVLIFSQMVDGFATAMGIDIAGGYSEKHIVSEWIRHQTEQLGGIFAEYPTFLGFATVKLLISLLVIYFIDVSGKEEAEQSPTMIGLIKFAIIMVGLGPGVRNMVRMSLGI